MPNEIELKLRISSTDLSRLRHHPAILAALTGRPVTRKLTSIYYDTPQLALLDAGISLRVRRMSGGWFQAVKAAGHSLNGLHQRMEWEDIIAAGHPDFSKITDPELTRIFDDPVLRAALAPIFTTEVQRTEWHLAWDNGDQVELALDLGTLLIDEGGERHPGEPISEIELELKGGDTVRLFDLALALQQDIPLQLENISKAQRGYAHYRPQPPAIVTARRTRLDRHGRASDAFRQIAQECLAQLQGNQEMVLHGQDAEGVHQMRIALRRLRSAVSIFGDSIDRKCALPLLAEIHWIDGVLGAARELDVFAAQTLPPMLLHLHGHPGLLQLRARADDARADAYAAVRAALPSPRYQHLLLALGAWLEGNRWHEPGSAEPDVLDIARNMLGKRHRQLLRHGRKLAKAQPEQRHAARIAAKKLRYTAEFFASLYPGKKTQPLLRPLTRLQDVLGELNDIAVTESLVRQLAGNRPGRALDEALHLFAGWNASNAMHRLEDMEQVWRKFSRCVPFW
ncbi:inorganic triphosphatase [mine drainage metagenome]|uniref:Inorganic triphosphatase n=1 Tax=mine drainage metagenome TaxID=410659 RepID=A0A1J5RI44_9ZZZZ